MGSEEHSGVLQPVPSMVGHYRIQRPRAKE